MADQKTPRNERGPSPMYMYLTYLAWWALAYYVARVATVKLVQWLRREEGETHPFAELLLGKLFGAKALQASHDEPAPWRSYQVVAIYALIVSGCAILVGNIAQDIAVWMVGQVVVAGEVDPATGKPFVPLTAAEERQVFLVIGGYTAAVMSALCLLQFGAMKIALWYFHSERVNPFNRVELDAWEEARKIKRASQE
jgi:hypothetical protein